MKKVVTFRIVSDLVGNDATSVGCPNAFSVDTENFDEARVPEPGT